MNDYLYNLQINETEHQNHRMSWALVIQAAMFIGVCTSLIHSDVCRCCTCISEQVVKQKCHCDCGCRNFVLMIDQNEALIFLMVIVGLLSAISFTYSMIVSELTIGHIIDTGNLYGSMKRSAPHVVIAAPKAILDSSIRWLAMHRFLPALFISAWLALIVIYIIFNYECT